MTSFEQILINYNIHYKTEGHHHCRSGWIQFDCPFCGKGTNKYHMGYSLDGRFANCWRCGHHSLASTIAELTGLSIKSKQLQSVVKSLPSEKIEIVERRGKLELPNTGKLLKQHKEYLRSRGFDNIEELETLWNIKGIGIDANLAWRIFLPIYYNGEVVSWTTRSISKETKRRYIGAAAHQEIIDKTHLLYGQHYARHAVIVCEGPFDVWKIGPGAVGTFGLNFSQQQILQLLKYPVRYICMDNEIVAQQRARGLADMLSLYPGDTYNIQLDSKDAGSASEKELKRLRRLVR